MPLAKGVPFVKPLKIYIYLKEVKCQENLSFPGAIDGFSLLGH